MSNKKVEVHQVVNTLRVLKDTCNVIHSENQNLAKENKELRSENDRLRKGEPTATIDNDDLFDAMAEIMADVKKWRSNTITAKPQPKRETSKARERRIIKQHKIES